MTSDAPPLANPPLTDAHITAWARLVRVSTQLLSEVEAALKAAGLPPLSWYDLLLELRRAEPEGLRPFQVEAKLLLPQYNVSRLVDRVSRAGLIQRLACDDDGRGQVIRLTGAGADQLRMMWPVYQGVLARRVGGAISADDAERLAALLASLIR